MCRSLYRLWTLISTFRWETSELKRTGLLWDAEPTGLLLLAFAVKEVICVFWWCFKPAITGEDIKSCPSLKPSLISKMRLKLPPGQHRAIRMNQNKRPHHKGLILMCILTWVLSSSGCTGLFFFFTLYISILLSAGLVCGGEETLPSPSGPT